MIGVRTSSGAAIIHFEVQGGNGLFALAQQEEEQRRRKSPPRNGTFVLLSFAFQALD
jgi:hypothetical protein